MNRRAPARRRQLLLALGAASLLVACASHPEPLTVTTYHETLTSLLLSQDRQHLVVIGEHYHYIFDAPAPLVEALASPLHAQMEGELGRFTVAADGRTQGDYALILPAAGLDETGHAQAVALGFQADPASAGTLRMTGRIEGQRYLQGTVKAHRVRTSLNHPYTVEIQAEQPRSEQVAHALVTPVSTAANGVTLLYYVVLAPIIVPFALLSRERAK